MSIDHPSHTYERTREHAVDRHSRKAMKTAQEVLDTLFHDYDGPVAFHLSGTPMASLPGAYDCVLHIHHPGVLRSLVLRRDPACMAEAFISGLVDIEGDLEALFDLVPWMESRRHPLSESFALLLKALALPRTVDEEAIHAHKAGEAQQLNTRRAISHHYDVGNDFYRLWLDSGMVYSCAYFDGPDQSLEQAQRDKLDYLCRKLRLSSGQKLLDIGCGWGALAIWAARHYGAQVRGITLSEQQHRLANKRIAEAGLEHLVSIELRDYRELDDRASYDRIVSVGMFEHIGIDNFSVYFAKARKLLKPGGLFLNHGITIKENRPDSMMKRFINQYIFPDGELARVSDVCDAMERAGFEIIDIESLRRHYAITLRRWVKALEERLDSAEALSSAETCRLWRLYMSGFAHYFDEGTVNVHQVLVAPIHDRLTLPLRRDDLYTSRPTH